MSWKKSTIGDVLSVIKNGINCEQNKIPVGVKITRIETIAKKRFDFERVGYANLTEIEKIKSKLRIGDILFSHINSPIHVGKTAIYEGGEDLYHGINLLLMRTNEDVNPYFFNHFLNQLFAKGYWEANCKKSVNQASVNQKDISKVEFSYPSLATQQKIVAKLDAIFAEIDKAKAAAESNAKNADSLLKSLIEDTFRQQFYKYKSVKLSEVTELSRGHNPPKSKFIYEPKEGYVRFYQIRDGSSDNKAVYVPDSPQLHQVDKDDILMVAYRHVGRAFRGVVGAFNVALCKIKNKNREVLSDDYLFYLIPSSFVRGELLKQSERSLIPSMSINHLKEISIPLPSIEIQKTTVERLQSIEESALSMKKSYEIKALNLDLIKQAILKQAFAGELVKE